ncbi:MAG: 1-acyl-sn-glycerol-3-phosphate acyltransferase, partial [Bacteroidetes bacterium]|nr:1-acyl-sn-glycerol-3-phosphate acyltransferase [Bacteroidota bacterium]
MKLFWLVFGNLWKLYVGFMFVLTSLLLYPVFLFILNLNNGKHRSFRYFVFWSRLFQFLCFYPVRNRGSKMPDSPFILIANHTSYLDIFLMFAHFPDRPFLFLGKSEILGYPILKTYFKKLNIPVDRSSRIKSAKSFLQAKKALEEGFSLIIFPEGGIPNVPAPKLAGFKDGAFRLAALMQVPIVPVALTNHYKLFSDPAEPFNPARPGISDAFVFDAVYLERDADVLLVRKECGMKIESKL